MNIKVGVANGGSLSQDCISEAVAALNVIAQKYNCQFELSGIDPENESKFKGENRLKSFIQKKGSDQNGVFLSFGGELEMD